MANNPVPARRLDNAIWGIADILRGAYRQHEYGQVILPLTILRRLECVMAPYRNTIKEVCASTRNEFECAAIIRAKTGLRFYNSSPFTLDDIWASGDNRAANLLEYMRSFSSDIDVFTRFKLDEQIEHLDEAGILGAVIQAFKNLNLSMEAVPNSQMGSLFEHLIFKDFEANNAEAGDHYTPRDAIHLLVDLLFAEDSSALTSRSLRTILDPAVGTGGMLSVAEDHIHELNPDAELTLFGQDINPNSYAICRSDMLAKGQDPKNIMLGNTLTEDQFADQKFDYVITNPPYGVDWKQVESEVRAEADRGECGRFPAGVPAVSDGAMLFLQHCIAKLRKPAADTPNGGRLGIVLNGSPLFNGGAGSGPSNIRGMLFKNDLLDAIVALPTDMFYNTGIATYLWIIDNNKDETRKGKVQLIDATKLGTKMRRNLGSKRVEINPSDRDKVVAEYADFSCTGISKIFDNLDFAYWAATVEQPLRLRFQITQERLVDVAEHKTLAKVKGLHEALASFDPAAVEEPAANLKPRVYLNRDEFREALGSHLGDTGVTLTMPQWKQLLGVLSEHDDEADICTDTKGDPEPDPGLRDTEIIPFGWGGFNKSHDAEKETLKAYLASEVLPYAPGAWIDWGKTKVGYEIPFTRHFFKYQSPRPLAEIDTDLHASVARIMALLTDAEAVK
jgi:type I restriction enzyme M protein